MIFVELGATDAIRGSTDEPDCRPLGFEAGCTMQIHCIPNKLIVEWLPDVHAIIDRWSSYGVTLKEFSAAVLDHGLGYARAHRGIAFIVDSSQAQGAFSQEIQAFIDSDVFPAFAASGIKYFITVTGDTNAITKMSVRRYAARSGPHGLELVEVATAQEAVEWLRKNAA